ncbi:MAG: hypothetical protein WCC08_10855 [Terrimicrobiaceae bacterium]
MAAPKALAHQRGGDSVPAANLEDPIIRQDVHPGYDQPQSLAHNFNRAPQPIEDIRLFVKMAHSRVPRLTEVRQLSLP